MSMTQQSENLIIRTFRRGNMSNILTMLGMAGCIFIYGETKYDKIIDAINSNKTDNAVIKQNMSENNRRVSNLELRQDKVEVMILSGNKFYNQH